jgi:hypothetical protein
MMAMQLLRSLLCSHILNKECGEKFPDSLTQEDWEQLYSLSNAHDLAHLTAHALLKSGLLPQNDVSDKFQRKLFQAVHRFEKMDYELKRICKTLEEAGIDHVPLKGAVVREYYPEPWMRSSCDIDILIHETDLDTAERALTEKLNYKKKVMVKYHDISLFSPSGVHLELHYSIREHFDGMDSVLGTVWNHVSLCPDKKHMYRQTPEFLLFHIIAHMAYHFQAGGCGIKPFIDLYLLRQSLNYNEDALTELCTTGKLTQFYQNALTLTNVWFGDASHTPITALMENFILHGGTYGTVSNRSAVEKNRAGSTVNQICKRIFMPRDMMEIRYPILRMHPILLPFCHVCRWFSLLSGKKISKSIHELQTIQSVTENASSDAGILMDQLGLL